MHSHMGADVWIQDRPGLVNMSTTGVSIDHAMKKQLCSRGLTFTVCCGPLRLSRSVAFDRCFPFHPEINALTKLKATRVLILPSVGRSYDSWPTDAHGGSLQNFRVGFVLACAGHMVLTGS